MARKYLETDVRRFIADHHIGEDGQLYLCAGRGQGPVPLIKKWTAQDVLWGLIEGNSHYANINIPEFRIYGGGRSLDLLRISAGEWGGNGDRIGYEIKISKADFATEMRNPAKYLESMRFCHRYYYVCPQGIIDPHKLPPKAGLIHVYQDDRDRWIGRWRSKVIVRPATNEPVDSKEFIQALASIAGSPNSFRGCDCLPKTDFRAVDITRIFGPEALDVFSRILKENPAILGGGVMAG